MRLKILAARYGRVGLSCWVILAAGVTAQAVSPSPTKAIRIQRLAAPDPRFGVVQAYQAPAQATQIGVGWERYTFWWRNIQPKGPSQFNLWATDRDHQINSEVAAGRQVVGLLMNTPDWAAQFPKEHGSSIPQGLYLPYTDPKNYWANFVKLIVKHYKGRIDDWILWNEVSIQSGQWKTWDGSVADYAQLVKVAYLAAKSVNPDANIVLYGDPYWYDHGAFFKTLMKDLSTDPHAAVNDDYFDAANLHLYSRPRDYQTVITLYNKTMARYGIHKPLWISETNAIPYNDPIRPYARSGYFGTLQDQASYLIEAFSLALALNVQHIEVNRMVDGTDFTAGGEPYGLLRNNHTARPEFYAFQAATELYSGVTGGTIKFNKHTKVYVVTLHKPGMILTVTWDQNPKPEGVSIPAVSKQAVAFNKYGDGNQVKPRAGRYRFTLPPSTDNTDPANPNDYVIGGSPIILMQST